MLIIISYYLIIAGDDNDADTGLATFLNGVYDFDSWWVEHSDDTHKGAICLCIERDIMRTTVWNMKMHLLTTKGVLITELCCKNKCKPRIV